MKKRETLIGPIRFLPGLIVGMLLLTGPEGRCQRGGPTDFWFNVGVGADYVVDSLFPGIGPAIRAGANFQSGQFNIGARFTGNTSAKTNYYGHTLGRTMRNQHYETALVSGYNISPEGEFWKVLSVGMGMVWGSVAVQDTASSSPENGMFVPRRPVIGLPLELAIVGYNKMPGIAFYLHANINRRATLFGLTLAFAFGTVPGPHKQ